MCGRNTCWNHRNRHTHIIPNDRQEQSGSDLVGMFPTSHHQEERRRSRGGRTPQTGSLHHLDFINEQSAGDTNSRFEEQRRVGVVGWGRLDQHGPCMLCCSEWQCCL